MKKFENIIIATDLDGTFFDSDEKPVAKNLKAIEYFTQNGGKFTIATGRALQSVLTPFPEAGKYVNLPIVICNGACIYDLANNQAVRKERIPFDIIQSVYSLIEREFPKAGVRVSGIEYSFISSPDQMSNAYVALDYQKCGENTIKKILPLEEWKNLEILKIVIRTDVSQRDEIITRINNEFGSTVAATYSRDQFIDVQLKGLNKGRALCNNVKNLFGNTATLYACGDYINDLEMLTLADVAVCPSNAHIRVKEISDLCLCNHNEGLMAALVEYLEEHLPSNV